MKLEELSTEELKAVGFDLIALIEQSHRNLQAINAEISVRANAPKEEMTPKEEG